MTSTGDVTSPRPTCPACGSDRLVELGSDAEATVYLCRDCDAEHELTR